MTPTTQREVRWLPLSLGAVMTSTTQREVRWLPLSLGVVMTSTTTQREVRWLPLSQMRFNNPSCPDVTHQCL